MCPYLPLDLVPREWRGEVAAEVVVDATGAQVRTAEAVVERTVGGDHADAATAALKHRVAHHELLELVAERAHLVHHALRLDMVSLLSGRNFETKSFDEAIAEKSFAQLRAGVDQFSNETNFKRFVMILRSAGFVDASLIRSRSTVNFAYIVYLKLRQLGTSAEKIESAVRRWFVMSILTGRYSGSPESSFDFDIKQIAGRGIDAVLQDREAADLSEAFWSCKTASIPRPAICLMSKSKEDSGEPL